MKKVIVTGSNGHLGYSLVKSLKEKGYQVRATVRNVHDSEKTGALRRLNVELVQADLRDPGSLERALEGMDGLFQVAANFDLAAKNPEEEVVRPNIEGTRNIMEAAHRAGIKKVVYTSSIASVGTIASGESPLDESAWNDDAIEPYAISKTRSERLAWELSGKLNVPLVTVLPGTIIGPDFHRLTSSLRLLKDVLDGKVPMALPLSLSYVDVRDVAMAHILVYEKATARGRYIATAETLAMSEVTKIIKEIRPGVKVSDRTMPVWLARALPAMDYLMHTISGAPRQMKRDLAREYLNRSQSYRSERLKNELNWSCRPIHSSFRETIDWMLRPELGLFDGKTKGQKPGREGLSQAVARSGAP